MANPEDIKLYPENSHMNFYKDWIFLGNNGLYDFYIQPNSPLGLDIPLLSIVCSNEPSDYISPHYTSLLDNPNYYKASFLDTYYELYKRLKEKDLLNL